MSRWSKFSETLLGCQSDTNIEYEELVSYLNHLGFVRTGGQGSHIKLKHELCPAALNMQVGKNGKAKSYQVEQVRAVLDGYRGEDKDGWLKG